MGLFRSTRRATLAGLYDQRPPAVFPPLCKVVLLVGLAVLLGSSTQIALADASNASDVDSTATPLRVVYFHSPSCGECHNVKKAFPAIINRWGSRIHLEQRSIEDIEVFNELFKYEEHYGAKVNSPPVIFVGSWYLKGSKDILGRLDSVIAEELSKGSVTFAPPKPDSEEASAVKEVAYSAVLERFQHFKVGAVVVACKRRRKNVARGGRCKSVALWPLFCWIAYFGKCFPILHRPDRSNRSVHEHGTMDRDPPRGIDRWAFQKASLPSI